MEKIIPTIRKIAENIIRSENIRLKLVNYLRDLEPEIKLIKKINPAIPETIKISATDGGMVKRSLHGLDCMLVRAVTVCFHYGKGRILKVEYYPSKLPIPRPFVSEALSEMDWNYFTSVKRQLAEVETSINSVKQFQPDILILHGPLVPHYQTKPGKGSQSYDDYSLLIEKCKKLFSTPERMKIIGVVEDSRGISFCSLVKDEIVSKLRLKQSEIENFNNILEKTRDLTFLYLYMKKGERTKVLSFSANPDDHPILKDLGQFNDKIYFFYLKTAEWDFPIRVDFLDLDNSPERAADELSSILLGVSGFHSGYGLPVPIIEADNAAKLSELDMENMYINIIAFTGNLPSTMKMRRESRPF